MLIGFMNLFQVSEGRSEKSVLDDFLEDVEFADDLGFDSVWLAEHHFSHYGIVGNPLMMGAAIAQRTKRIKIGTAILVLPFYNPLRLAEDIALLDILSEGRVSIGCGRGYQPIEFNGFGIDAAEARERYNEVLDILMLALREENWSYHGKYHHYDKVTTYPRPLTPGGPVLLHGAVNPESFASYGTLGRRVITSPTVAPLERVQRNCRIYRENLTAAGFDPAEFRFPFMQQVWAGHSETMRQKVGEAALAYRRYVSGYLPNIDTATEEERARYFKIQENYQKMTVEQLLRDGGCFGDPDYVSSYITKLGREIGVDEYIGLYTIPNIDRKVALASMETFAKEVMPRVRLPLAAEPAGFAPQPAAAAPAAAAAIDNRGVAAAAARK